MGIFNKKQPDPVVILPSSGSRKSIAQVKRGNSGVPHISTSTIFLFVLLISSVAFAVYSHREYNAELSRILVENELAELNRLVVEVSKQVDIPEDETPLVATVNNKEKLSGEPFFKAAQLGDKVLVFCKAKRTILYSPTQELVLNQANSVLEDVCGK